MLGAVTSDDTKGSAMNFCSSLAEQGGVGINRQPKSDTPIQENPQITWEHLTFRYGFVIYKISIDNDSIKLAKRNTKPFIMP